MKVIVKSLVKGITVFYVNGVQDYVKENEEKIIDVKSLNDIKYSKEFIKVEKFTGQNVNKQKSNKNENKNIEVKEKEVKEDKDKNVEVKEETKPKSNRKNTRNTKNTKNA